jgi:hypothetical protein
MKQMNKNEKVYLDIHATELFLSFLGMGIGMFGGWAIYEYPQRFPEAVMLVTVGVMANLVALLGVREKTRRVQ